MEGRCVGGGRFSLKESERCFEISWGRLCVDDYLMVSRLWVFRKRLHTWQVVGRLKYHRHVDYRKNYVDDIESRDHETNLKRVLAVGPTTCQLRIRAVIRLTPDGPVAGSLNISMQDDS